MASDSVIGELEGATPAADALRLARMPTDDLGMGERLIARYGERLAKTPDAGWLAYADAAGIWQRGAPGEAQARRYAHQVARALWEEYRAAKAAVESAAIDKGKADGVAGDAIWDGLPGALLDAIGKAGNSSSTNSMLTQAASYLIAKLADFDPDPDLICCANGTLKPTFVGEPCFVAYDADGVVAGYLKVAFVTDSAPRSEPGVETAPVWKVAGWRIRQLPREGDGPPVFEVIAPDDDEADASRVSDAMLKAGVVRRGLTLRRKLYHLDVKRLPHQPGHRITRQTTVAYDPTAKCPLWRQHMATVLPVEEDRRFFQRAMGYGLVGANDAQCFLLMQGRGADGKSTTMKTIVKVMGSYHHTSSPLTWMETKQRSGSDASPDMADLAGDTRMVYAEEPPKGARLNEGLLKQITGGLELRARQLHKDLFDFAVKFLLVMAFNDQPRIAGGDDGFWRRMRLIRWPHQFTREEQLAAGNMVDKLLTEGPGILNWLLEGLGAYHQFGLQPTARMTQDILDWRSTADPFGEWLRERVEIKGGEKELTSALYTDYKDFLEAEGIDGREMLGKKAFTNRLQSQQIEAFKTDGGQRFRRGVKLKPRPPEWGIAGGMSGKRDPRDEEDDR